MFLTAHRVESTDGKTGVNAYLFLHFDDPLPTLATSEPDVAYTAQFAAGTCVADEESIQPGGNTVKCSLDIACADDHDATAIRRIVARLRDRVRVEQPPTRIADPDAAAMFRATLDFDDDVDARLAALDELWSRALRLIDQARVRTRPAGPLVVWVRYRPEGVELSLPSATRARLGGHSLVSRVKALLPSDVVAHFPGQGAEALVEVAQALTGKSRDQLRLAGGLSFVEPWNETEVLRWPPVRGDDE